MQSAYPITSAIAALIILLPLLSCLIAALFGIARNAQAMRQRKRKPYANRYMQARAQSAERYTARRPNYPTR